MIKIKTDWETLSKIGRNKIMQYTILMPVFGYMILFNDYLVDNYELITINPWKLYAIYFGFALLGIGSLLYLIGCPKVIKENTSLSEYIAREYDILLHYSQLVVVAQRVAKLCQKYDDEHVEKEHGVQIVALKNNIKLDPVDLDDIDYRLNDPVDLILEQELSNKKEVTPIQILTVPHIKQVMIAYYSLSNSSERIIAIATLVLYLFGFIVLSFPTLGLFFEVSGKLIDHTLAGFCSSL